MKTRTEIAVVDPFTKKSGLSENATLKPSAPNWAKEGWYELIALGRSPKEAIAKLKESPFFQDNWVNQTT
jgi:hypothetical protein